MKIVHVSSHTFIFETEAQAKKAAMEIDGKVNDLHRDGLRLTFTLLDSQNQDPVHICIEYNGKPTSTLNP